MNFDDPDVRRIMRKKTLQTAIAWGKEHAKALEGDAVYCLGALIFATQQTVREEFGEEAFQETASR